MYCKDATVCTRQPLQTGGSGEGGRPSSSGNGRLSFEPLHGMVTPFGLIQTTYLTIIVPNGRNLTLTCAQVKTKLSNLVSKGYIATGRVESLTSFFAIPKGHDDVCMVYDATKSGLNQAIWVPSFALPTVDILTNMLDLTSWMSDLDMGEQFLNFPLDPNLQPYCGIDVPPYLGTTAGNQTNWVRWTCCMIGLTSSPYVAIKGTHVAEETVFGDRYNSSNPF
jgi:hypothetical protein